MTIKDLNQGGRRIYTIDINRYKEEQIFLFINVTSLLKEATFCEEIPSTLGQRTICHPETTGTTTRSPYDQIGFAVSWFRTRSKKCGRFSEVEEGSMLPLRGQCRDKEYVSFTMKEQ
ncbi:unnamed protein product, partial [Ranitomeya imitator]